MSTLAVAAVHTAWATFAAATPSPDPTEGVLRPGVEETDISPGLTGFLVTFALAAVCVLLFFSFSRHLRTARRNAEEQGLEIEQKKGIGIRRDPGAEAPGGEPDGASGREPEGGPDAPEPPGGDGAR